MDDREYELKQAELALKEREVTAREREVTAKETESYITWWKNPLIVGLIGATLALAGNIITNVFSNRASDKSERVRAQSSLVLSVIRTNGNEEDACKNPNFFVRIGWLDDPNGAINNSCGKKGQDGVPTLPSGLLDGVSAAAGSVSGLGLPIFFQTFDTLHVTVEDADSHQPIENAAVQVDGPSPRSTSTDAKGETIVNFVSSYDSLSATKDGYMTQTQRVGQSGFILPPQATITIDLHRALKPKH
jgi:hypothetical protein